MDTSMKRQRWTAEPRSEWRKNENDESKLKAQVRKVQQGALLVILGCMLIMGLSMDRIAEWSEYESSPIDWCETNYAVHSHVVEFWNAISSIPIAMVAPFAWMHDLVPARVWLEFSKVKVIFVLVVLIGVGSTYFHATLSVFGQIMDEMSIIWLVLYAALFVMPKGRGRLLVASAFLRPVFVAFILSTTLLGLLSPLLSHIFVLSCCPFGLYVLVSAYRRSRNMVARSKFKVALWFFAAAWACWLTDKFACAQMQAIGRYTGYQPQLHAVWHCLVSIVAYITVGVCSEFREEIQFGFRSLQTIDAVEGLEVV